MLLIVVVVEWLVVACAGSAAMAAPLITRPTAAVIKSADSFISFLLKEYWLGPKAQCPAAYLNCGNSQATTGSVN